MQRKYDILSIEDAQHPNAHERSVSMGPKIPVLISMHALSNTDPSGHEAADPIHMLVPGDLTIEGSIYTLRYQESQTDEATGAVATQQIKLTLEPGRVVMTREGDFGTTMVFVRGQRFEGAYHTPYGDLEMAVYATRADCELTPLSGSVHLKYTLDMQGAFAAQNTLELTYAARAQEPS